MAQKYHIDRNGKPAPCRATKRPCPLGGEEAHFDSMEEAQAFVDQQNQEQFGLFGVQEPTNPHSPFGISKDELNDSPGNLNAAVALDLSMNDPTFFAAASDNFEENGKIKPEVEENMRKNGVIGANETLLTEAQYEAATGSAAVNMKRHSISDDSLRKAGLSKKMTRFMRGPLRTEGTGTAMVVHNKDTGEYTSITQLEAMTLNPNNDWAKSMAGDVGDDFAGNVYDDYKVRNENRPIVEEQFTGGTPDTGVALMTEMHSSGMTDGMTDSFTLGDKLDDDYVNYGKETGVFKGTVSSGYAYESTGGDASSLPRAELSKDDLTRLGVSPNLVDKVHSSAQHDDGSAAVVVKGDDGQYKRYTDYEAALINSTSPSAASWRKESARMKKEYSEKFADIFK